GRDPGGGAGRERLSPLSAADHRDRLPGPPRAGPRLHARRAGPPLPAARGGEAAVPRGASAGGGEAGTAGRQDRVAPRAPGGAARPHRNLGRATRSHAGRRARAPSRTTRHPEERMITTMLLLLALADPAACPLHAEHMAKAAAHG